MKDKISLPASLNHVFAGGTIDIETIPWLLVSLLLSYLS